MNVAVIGVGGVGGYFGGKISQLLSSDENLNVYFIARNEHLKEIQRNGLLLDTNDGQYMCKPTLATDDPNLLPILDFVLLCTKSYDVEKAVHSIASKTTDKTIVLPLLNGVDIYDRVKRIIPQAAVLPACVYIGTHIERPGKIKQNGGACTIHFGVDPQRNTPLDDIINLFEKSGIKYNYSNDPEGEIWSKFIFIASFGLITAYYNKTIGQVLENIDLKLQVSQIMTEIYKLAQAKRVKLPVSIVSDSIEKGQKFSYDTKTSFQRDYEVQNKQDERNIFGGTVIEMGKTYAIHTPVTSSIYQKLNAKALV